MDEAVFEVDVFPFECLQFAGAEVGVEGRCPKRLLVGWECGDQGRGFLGAGDAVALAADCG